MAFDQLQQPGDAGRTAQAAPGASQPSDSDGDEAPAGSIVITPSEQGFTVDTGEGPQPVASVAEVIEVVQAALGGGEDPQAMWQQEAAAGSASRPPQPGAAPRAGGMGGGAPRMTM